MTHTIKQLKTNAMILQRCRGSWNLASGSNTNWQLSFSRCQLSLSFSWLPLSWPIGVEACPMKTVCCIRKILPPNCLLCKFLTSLVWNIHEAMIVCPEFLPSEVSLRIFNLRSLKHSANYRDESRCSGSTVFFFLSLLQKTLTGFVHEKYTCASYYYFWIT